MLFHVSRQMVAYSLHISSDSFAQQSLSLFYIMSRDDPKHIISLIICINSTWEYYTIKPNTCCLDSCPESGTGDTLQFCQRRKGVHREISCVVQTTKLQEQNTQKKLDTYLPMHC